MSTYQPRHSRTAEASTERRLLLRAAGAAAVVAPAALVVAPSASAATRPTLQIGSKGSAVRTLQQRLLEKGYWHTGADGEYGQSTQQAVMAVQKRWGLTRDGVCGPTTWAAIDKLTRPGARSTSGTLLEVDLRRQLVYYVRDGRMRWCFNTSTGNGERYWSEQSGRYLYAVTPTGRFSIYRQIDGMRNAPLGGLWRPKYFTGGIAFHGSPSIPGYPASHGCCRLSNAAINYFWSSGMAPIGRKVWVY